MSNSALPVAARRPAAGAAAYKAYTLHSFRNIPQVRDLPESRRREVEVVGSVLPFKTNNYVVDELIDWSRVPDDPIFILNFPQRDMLKPNDFSDMESILLSGADSRTVRETANAVRRKLNPHPAGQISHNVPTLHGDRLGGIQHKYRETMLFFPSQGQTCHAYCSFCFRWPQFVGVQEWKFAMKETEQLVGYLREHPEITDVLFTGGDPLIMKTKHLEACINGILHSDLPHVQTIRIGSKALSCWPYRFLSDDDADDLLRLFEKVADSGRHLALMAHFNHPAELKTKAVKKAIARIRSTGAQIRTQSPLLSHLNDDPALWIDMWKEQVKLGCIPYYMFVVRDTGAQHYFGVPLVRAWEVFREAYSRVSGVARTVRGPSMSADPGKVQVLGVTKVGDRRVMSLRFIQGRNPDWVHRPFFAEYDEEAIWLDELKPAFGKTRFLFEREMAGLFAEN